MPCNIDTQAAQLLNESPDFRAAGCDLLGNLRSAHDDRRVLHQETNDQSQAKIGGQRLVSRFAGCSLGPAGSRWLLRACCAWLADAEIMRESRGNNNVWPALGGNDAHAHIGRMSRVGKETDR